MPLLRCAAVLVLLIFSYAVIGKAQNEKPFPTNDEINLLLTQTERAIQQYKPLIDQEEIQMGQSYKDAAANDRNVVGALENFIKNLKTKPQGFNSPAGFLLFETLDDADRNALLCSSGAALQVPQTDTAAKAFALVHLAQSCQDASALIYTVSENVGSLYEKYLEAQAQLAGQAVETMQRCIETLKKNGPAKK
jgi:hypothetical protein